MRSIETRPRHDGDPCTARLGEITAELARCLERFVNGTADEPTLARARRVVDVWNERRGVNVALASQVSRPGRSALG